MRFIVAAEDSHKPTTQSECTGSEDVPESQANRRAVMSMWLWVNLSFGAVFVLAIVAIPLWMVLRRPDTGPAGGAAPAVRPAHALAREATAHVVRTARWQAAAAALAASRQEAGGQRPASRRPRPEFDRA
jgi:hypothetical protein